MPAITLSNSSRVVASSLRYYAVRYDAAKSEASRFVNGLAELGCQVHAGMIN